MEENSTQDMSPKAKALVEELRAKLQTANETRLQQERDLARLRGELRKARRVQLKPKTLAQNEKCFVIPYQDLEVVKSAKKNLYVCLKCQISFTKEEEWRSHVDAHFLDDNSKTASAASNTTEHEVGSVVEQTKAGMSRRTHYCSLCDKFLSSKSSYNYHLKSTKHLQNIILRKCRPTLKSSRILKLKVGNKFGTENFEVKKDLMNEQKQESYLVSLSEEDIDKLNAELSNDEESLSESGEVLPEGSEDYVEEDNDSSISAIPEGETEVLEAECEEEIEEVEVEEDNSSNSFFNALPEGEEEILEEEYEEVEIEENNSFLNTLPEGEEEILEAEYEEVEIEENNSSTSFLNALPEGEEEIFDGQYEEVEIEENNSSNTFFDNFPEAETEILETECEEVEIKSEYNEVKPEVSETIIEQYDLFLNPLPEEVMVKTEFAGEELKTEFVAEEEATKKGIELFAKREHYNYFKMGRGRRGQRLTVFCSICRKVFHNRYQWREHENGHRGIKPYSCPDCGKRFGTTSNLKKHRLHHEDPVLCEVCGQSFATPMSLRNHKRVHSDEKPYSCKICSKNFRWARNLNAHMRLHSDKRFVCVYCGKVLSSDSILKAHEDTHRGITSYACDDCGETFTQRATFHLHRDSKCGNGKVPSENPKVPLPKKFMCEVCGKAFSCKSLLMNHELMHSGVKVFECSDCNKSFANKKSLTIHRRLHTGEKPFECEVCHNRYRQVTALNSHKATHLTVKPHQCGVCSKRFSLKNSLKLHMRVHTGEKPHQCPICGRYFRQSTHVKGHMRIVHEGIKEHFCEVCGRAFSSPGNLQQHAATHQPNQEVCQICSRTFSNKYILSSHLKKHVREAELFSDV